ncbi:hypothetical protein RAH32_08275 [Paracoccus sp. WLY502]|uniref:hypothetical protein n=1 Tax=Paracoccus yibinensis TaxID=3068891 RepID=UPI002796DED6|nr:hypothetical protein [Paracoccus sp. WLY502]MDQ1900439.1 hypothetical protein [Paracoccus sp. WLY502]
MKDTRSLVDLVCMNPNKEEEAWAWFCIGAELQKIGRNYRSTKKFGEAVSSTPLSHLPASDRSDARWMFQNWKDVLNWLEVESGLPVEDPFLMLSNLNHSHPSAIRRKVRLLKENIINDVATNGELKEVGRIAFERAWKASGTEMEISNPSFEGGEGIWYLVEAYDPFSGSGSAKYLFDWEEVLSLIQDPKQADWLHRRVEEWIVEEQGYDKSNNGEMIMDDKGRFHFRSDLKDY